jgi:type II secretory pathway pseudopilin PulG
VIEARQGDFHTWNRQEPERAFAEGRALPLIELLIVVAIIAILAAIAVPNFLEAQTRSKVSRTLADMRTIRTGLETYYVDNNKYPETDQAISGATAGKRSYFRLTTPVAYLTSIPGSPFKEKYGTASLADPKLASTINGYCTSARSCTIQTRTPTRTTRMTASPT